MYLKLFRKIMTQKSAEVTGDLIQNKISNKITNVLQKLPQNNSVAVESKSEMTKEIQTSKKKIQKYINDLSKINAII